MSRTPDQIAMSITGLRAMGWASPGDPVSYDAAHDQVAAAEFARIEASMEGLQAQIDPRQAQTLLTDYERVLGPDPCGRDQLGLSFADRQALAFQRWTARGTICAGFFIAAAAALGVAMSIEEFPRATCGTTRCGRALRPSPTHMAFRVTLPLSRLTIARCGTARCGDRLGQFTPSLMECVVRQYAPAFSFPYFRYV